MKLHFYFPENLDLDNLIDDNYPTFTPFVREKARYLLHLISVKRLNKKDSVSEEYTKLSSKIMQDMVHNYHEYWNYFINDLKIVERTKSYQTDKFCKGYKFSKEYDTPIAKSPLTLQDRSIRKKLINYINRIKSQNRSYTYLSKWFDDKLQIDEEISIWAMNEIFNIKQEYPELRDINITTGKEKRPMKQKDFALGSIQRFKEALNQPRRDNNVLRYHSVLTNMNSIYRNAVTYNGEELHALDLKNSQIFLSTKLLSTNYLIRSFNNGAKVDIIFDNPIEMYKRLTNQPFLEVDSLNSKVTKCNLSKTSYIMLGLFKDSPLNMHFQEYFRLAIKGNFYENLREKIHKELGVYIESRGDVKRNVFKFMFSEVHSKSKFVKLFEALFPEVYKVFYDIKKHDHSVLPRALQRVESNLFIDRIAKRISKELPKAPIYTIHDSIASTKQYIPAIRKIMEEEFLKTIGAVPGIKEEHWCKDNIIKEVNELKQKAFAKAS
ncbi:hypothetical protein [Seonamhaeicola sp. ML3]|uniref:hypothetical protein n=1 Tax=Seonamhaeicola sp. ML3 TaxID=2937786 RepID=UPI00200C32F8|nr:hypothetical protein [Seonamhaeicola sp. ML3]